MALLLDRRAVLHQLLRHGLVGGFEDVDERARQVLFGLAEERDSAAGGACAAGSVGGDALVGCS